MTVEYYLGSVVVPLIVCVGGVICLVAAFLPQKKRGQGDNLGGKPDKFMKRMGL